jgi:hypothetical protein
MGGEVKIWNPVEIAEQARNDYASQIFPSLLTIDPSLSLPQMTPLVMFVIPNLLSFLYVSFNYSTLLDFQSFFPEIDLFNLINAVICARTCSRPGQNLMILALKLTKFLEA